MAPSAAYSAWVAAGRPYTLITPAAALQRNVRRYGITVYDYPDTSHLLANTPEDHTPFSATGWPGPNKRWNARAVDIMPRGDSPAHRKENADIARQIIADKDADHPGTRWVKYLNWTDEKGVCQHVSWTPDKAVRGSADRGHIHVSGRSDFDTWTGAEDYDPVARMRGDDDMGLTQDQWLVLLRVDERLGTLIGGLLAVPSSGGREPNAVAQRLGALEAAAAADEVRDRAMLAAIQAAVSGGGVDAAPILDAISQVRDETRARFAELAAQLDAETARAERAEAQAAQYRAALRAALQSAHEVLDVRADAEGGG